MAEVAAPSVEDWPVGDDFLLREAVEAGAALASIARGILPFSRAYSCQEVTDRWRCVPPAGSRHDDAPSRNPPAREIPRATRPPRPAPRP